MFNFLKKKPKGSVATFKIDGMHCTSCSMNIDGELEDTEGVISAMTSYAKGETVVEYDESVVAKDKITSIIEDMEYSVQEVA